jgi:hypothetical protein
MKLRENTLQNIKSDLQTVRGHFGISQIIVEKSKAIMDVEYVNECIMKAAWIFNPKNSGF